MRVPRVLQTTSCPRAQFYEPRRHRLGTTTLRVATQCVVHNVRVERRAAVSWMLALYLPRVHSNALLGLQEVSYCPNSRAPLANGPSIVRDRSARRQRAEVSVEREALLNETYVTLSIHYPGQPRIMDKRHY